MKWLYKLEYKFGRRYIHRLMTIVVIGMAFVYVADLMMPNVNIVSWLVLARDPIIHQFQLWRLVTFIFIPPLGNPFLTLISLYFYYMIGNSLESIWGGFRLNLYYLIGILGAIAAMFITGYGDNTYLNLSLFLAFATVAPDTQFMLFFILPIKAKWMAIFYAAMLLFSLVNTFFASVMAGIVALVLLLFSLLNYVLFFGRKLLDGIRNQIRISKNRRNWHNNTRR